MLRRNELVSVVSHILLNNRVLFHKPESQEDQRVKISREIVQAIQAHTQERKGSV